MSTTPAFALGSDRGGQASLLRAGRGPLPRPPAVPAAARPPLAADTWWFRLLSFLPPLAPILMPTRLAAGHLAPWEVPLAVVLMLAAIAGVVRVTARIYALSLVRSGARLSWGEALRLRAG